MNFLDFNILTELEKLGALLQYGHLLNRTTERDCRGFLYQVEDFYVIIRYTIKDDQLQNIQIFREITEAIPNLRKSTSIADPSCRVTENGER